MENGKYAVRFCVSYHVLHKEIDMIDKHHLMFHAFYKRRYPWNAAWQSWTEFLEIEMQWKEIVIVKNVKMELEREENNEQIKKNKKK